MLGAHVSIVANWENKLVCCVTNVGLSCHSDYCSITSNNYFFTILIIFSATLLSSYKIDSSLTLISNMFVHRILDKVRNPCIDCKDCVPISIGFYSSMKVFNQD